ncbi:Helicase associated domain protein [Undibacterium sp. Jales W-56]|uniref:DEAD/DEAH box helicase n=1 Tax=Undibacterium sp. Jales W-56 TaxID=2897325 RepID=UPI0021D25CBC|nr:DEAD/DEAH box helicase [Undibacterium sp. Jales W-56]MCU6433972.1 Helicase associated domain protein [Undibacterium sp. Jales W-56]
MTALFSDFYQSLDSDTAKRGKQFEHFVKWFLTADPEWSTQIDQIWLWDDWPGRWGADCGIDLVFRHKNGENWAVQAKCYSPDYHITKHDVDKFLSESNRKGIDHRLLVATTDLIGGNARQVCEAQEKPVIRFLLSDFGRAELEYPANMASLALGKRRAPPQPREHQIEAIDAAVQGLHSAERGQLIMACGTGKTYVTLWVKERLSAHSTLVLVPSLGLLSQTLREWTFAATSPFEVLCVCSDQTVGKKGDDESIHTVADLAFPVTSDADAIKRFLAGAGNRVVFSTYQSSAIVALAQADATIPAFDLVVADEAHRCAGKVDSAFSTVLDGAQIRSHKRLFATATPRTYASNIKKAAEERGVEVVGMDNVSLFGEVLYALPFGQAIARKLLTDYRVVVIGVDDPTIAAWIANRDLVATDTGIETDTESLAAQIGLLKAIKDYDLKRVISFHSRVKRAEAFTTEVQQVIGWIGEEHRPSGSLRTDFVSGDMPASKRKVKLDQLKSLNADERGVLSNARCLSEGVDVPSLDGVAFIDPRSSQVDIIQAVGRAIRLSPDKKVGTIILPVFIATGNDAEEAIEASNFKPIWDVLNALKAHDDELAAELDQVRTGLGKRPGSVVRSDSLRKISFDLPASVDAAFGSALRTHLVEQVTASWNFWFGLLQAFVEREQHCQIPQDYRAEERYRLGWWIGTQRQAKEALPPSRKAMLEATPGWTWNVFSDKWDLGLRYLSDFADREGHCRVPRKFSTPDRFRLGLWVSVQRMAKDDLLPGRKERLEAVVGWVWDAIEDQWEMGVRHLEEFVGREGHSKVERDYRTPTGFPLGTWVKNQRVIHDDLSDSRKERLEAMPGWAWNLLDEQWEIGLRYLTEFADREGHCQVPVKYETSDGFRLGQWLTVQRKKRDVLPRERRSRLEAIPGWGLDVLSEQWEKGYRELVDFAAREGRSDVPQRFKTTNGYSLGWWVSTQRQKKDSLSPDRRARLEAIAGWVWAVVSDEWELGFRHLAEFVAREGHCQVSGDHLTADGYRLGQWVTVQRAKKESLSTERKALLESTGSWIWSVRAEQWELGYRHLTEFVAREGHCRVAAKHQTTDGFRLGLWISNLRKTASSLPAERIERLEALPGWLWRARNGTNDEDLNANG